MPVPPRPPATDALVEAISCHLGISPSTAELDLRWREWRWMALLGELVVVVAASEAGWQRLCLEADLMASGRRATGSIEVDGERCWEGVGLGAWPSDAPESESSWTIATEAGR